MKINKVALIGIFTSCWAAVELVVGSILHPAPSSIFSPGAILIIFIIPLLTAVNKLEPRFGSITVIGLFTAILKLISVGGVKFVPALAIFIEALIFDLIIHLFPESYKKSKIIAAGLSAAVAGSAAGAIIGGYTIGLFDGKTWAFISYYLCFRVGKALIGGVIGTIIGITVQNRLAGYVKN